MRKTALALGCIAALASLVVGVAHGARRQTDAPRLVGSRPIVAFGDSITWGNGASRNGIPIDLPTANVDAHLPAATDTSYPSDLARLLGRPVLDYGHSGETTREGLRRLPSVLAVTDPSVVVVLEGVNDLQFGLPESGTLRRLARMVGLIRAAHARPMVLTVLPTAFPLTSREHRVNGQVRRLDGRIRRLGRAERVPVIDASQAFGEAGALAGLLRHPDGTLDGIHPGDRGYRVLAHLVARQLSYTRP